MVFLQDISKLLHALSISIVSTFSIAIYCYYTLSLNHYSSLLMTCGCQDCVERQSIISKCKFQGEFAGHVEEPFLPHLVPELEMKKKKQKLPPLPVERRCPFLNMKLSWDGSPEIIVRTILDCGANVQVVSQTLVEISKILRVL